MYVDQTALTLVLLYGIAFVDNAIRRGLKKKPTNEREPYIIVIRAVALDTLDDYTG